MPRQFPPKRQEARPFRLSYVSNKEGISPDREWVLMVQCGIEPLADRTLRKEFPCHHAHGNYRVAQGRGILSIEQPHPEREALLQLPEVH
jgi:hypothetical protein